MIRRRSLIGLLLAVALQAAPPAPSLADLSEAEFSRLPALAGAVDPATLDRDLLAWAIFHESNRVRRQLGLPEFAPLVEAAAAADLQATTGAIQRKASHDNPLPSFATPLDRARRAGVKGRGVSENVALTSFLNVGRGGALGVQRINGRERFINLETGEPLQPHTYASFAADVVAKWMASPGHRANLVAPAARQLGCAVRATRGLSGADLIYSVQVLVIP